jgi:hypothetical protein
VRERGERGRCSRAQEYVPQRWQADGVRRTLADDFSFMCVDMTWRAPPPSLLCLCVRAPSPAPRSPTPLALRRHARATAYRGPARSQPARLSNGQPRPAPPAPPRARLAHTHLSRSAGAPQVAGAVLCGVCVRGRVGRVRGGLLGAALGVPRHAGRRQAGRHVARRGARAADGLRRAPDHCLQLRQVAAGLRPAHPKAAIERQLLLARVHTSRRAAGAPRPPCWRLSGVQVHRGAACAGACMAPVLPRAGLPLVLGHQPGHDRLWQLGAPRRGSQLLGGVILLSTRAVTGSGD